MVAAVLAVVRALDQVIRAAFLPVLSILAAGLVVGAVVLRGRSRTRAALVAVALGTFQVITMFLDAPADQYADWASRLPDRPNLLGVASVTVSLLLTAALALALAMLLTRPRWLLAAARVLLALVLVTDLGYGWAAASTGTSKLARLIVWRDSDVLDHQRFPARTIRRTPPAFTFARAPGADRIPKRTVPVREGDRVVERDLTEFLSATRTTAFIAIKDDTILFESYFRGYRHDSTVPSFSVAKPFVSALVGIALGEGLIGSLDDPVTTYLPELSQRNAAFARITLRHLLTMSSGLAHQDPYYDLDLRVAALKETEIAEPPGRRFHYNNINTVLLGLVLERVTGGPVSVYLERELWGPLGMEADGSWSMDGERSAVEQMQAGINARAVDFAKFGALYLHGGSWRGKQLIPRAWVTDSTRMDSRTDPSPDFQYSWWTRPDGFWGQGNHGQFVYVDPARNVVLVRFGVEYDYEHWPETLAALAARL